MEKAALKEALSLFAGTEIAKAGTGASPAVNRLLRELFPGIDFERECSRISMARGDEAEKIQAEMIRAVNGWLKG